MPRYLERIRKSRHSSWPDLENDRDHLRRLSMGLGLIDKLVSLSKLPVLRPAVLLAERLYQEYGAIRFQVIPSVYADPVGTTREPGKHLALVTGYFSNDLGRATFGDTEAMRVVTENLQRLGIPFDVAGSISNGLVGVDINAVDPNNYTIVIFVCGPWIERNNAMFDRFQHAYKIGINLSIDGDVAHPFDLLLSRDSGRHSVPDLVFSSSRANRPLVGIALAHDQFEYGGRQQHAKVREIVSTFRAETDVSTIDLDTLHLDNKLQIRNAADFEALVSRLDVVVTTRLHGLVFSLKNGVPAVAIDAITGGAKVSAQAAALGWPVVFSPEEISVDKLRQAVTDCLSGMYSNELANAIDRAAAGNRVVLSELENALVRLKRPSA